MLRVGLGGLEEFLRVFGLAEFRVAVGHDVGGGGAETRCELAFHCVPAEGTGHAFPCCEQGEDLRRGDLLVAQGVVEGGAHPAIERLLRGGDRSAPDAAFDEKLLDHEQERHPIPLVKKQTAPDEVAREGRSALAGADAQADLAGEKRGCIFVKRESAGIVAIAERGVGGGDGSSQARQILVFQLPAESAEDDEAKKIGPTGSVERGGWIAVWCRRPKFAEGGSP